jgi:hypothetical protein
LQVNNNLPTTQAAAQSNLLVVPSTGPNASASLQANTALAVSYGNYSVFGGTTFEYPLAEYLYTWFSSLLLGPTVILRFCNQIAAATNRQADLNAAREFCAVWANRYPLLVAKTAGDTTRASSGSLASYLTQTHAGLLADAQTVTFPINYTGTPMYMLPGCSITWLTSRLLGLTTDKASAAVVALNNWNEIYSQPQLTQWSRYAARLFAMVYHTFYAINRLPVSIWDNLYGNTPFVAIRQLYRNVWINPEYGSNNTRALTAPMGTLFANMMAALSPFRPTSDSWGNCLFHYLNAPQNGFGPIWKSDYSASYSTVTPSILTDNWAYTCMSAIPRGMQTFPVPLNKPRGIRNAWRMLQFADGTLTIPVDTGDGRNALNISTDNLPCTKADELFNSRLTWMCSNVNADLYTTDGVVYSNADRPPTNQLAMQRIIVPDFLMPNYVRSQVVTACSTWIPAIDATGKNLIVAVPGGSNPYLMSQIMAGVSYATIQVWISREKPAIPTTILSGPTLSSDHPLLRAMRKAASAGQDMAKNSSASSSNGSARGVTSSVPPPTDIPDLGRGLVSVPMAAPL